MWHTICYVSTSAELSDFQMNELMHSSKIKNEHLGIKGVLIHSDQNFFQVLEGDKTIILELYTKIRKDLRHFNLIKIFERPIKVPCFTNFHHSYTVIHQEKNYSELQNFLNLEKHYNPKNYKNISYIARKFMKLS